MCHRHTDRHTIFLSPSGLQTHWMAKGIRMGRTSPSQPALGTPPWHQRRHSRKERGQITVQCHSTNTHDNKHAGVTWHAFALQHRGALLVVVVVVVVVVALRDHSPPSSIACTRHPALSRAGDLLPAKPPVVFPHATASVKDLQLSNLWHLKTSFGFGLHIMIRRSNLALESSL